MKTLSQAEFNAINRQSAAGFDVSGQLDIMDRRFQSELAGEDLSGFRSQLAAYDVLVFNRKEQSVQAITENEFDKILHLIL